MLLESDNLSPFEIAYREEPNYHQAPLTSLTFTLESATTCKIRIVVSGGTYDPNNETYLEIKQICLTKSIGTGLVSQVEYGGFEQTGTPQISTKWSATSGDVSTSSVSGFEGQSLLMNGVGIGIPYLVKQTLYEASSAEISAFESAICSIGFSFDIGSAQYARKECLRA